MRRQEARPMGRRRWGRGPPHEAHTGSARPRHVGRLNTGGGDSVARLLRSRGTAEPRAQKRRGTSRDCEDARGPPLLQARRWCCPRRPGDPGGWCRWTGCGRERRETKREFGVKRDGAFDWTCAFEAKPRRWPSRRAATAGIETSRCDEIGNPSPASHRKFKSCRFYGAWPHQSNDLASATGLTTLTVPSGCRNGFVRAPIERPWSATAPGPQ